MIWNDIAAKFLHRGLSRKMLAGLTLLIFSIIILMGLSVYYTSRSRFMASFEGELRTTGDLIHGMTVTAVNTSIKSHLTTIARKNLDLVGYYHGMNVDGKIGYAAAIDAIRTIFLYPPYGRIGSSGYLAIISGDGKTVVHPKLPAGYDMSGYEFMRRALSMKEGYIEYSWKNPGEEKEREKAAALAYFPPWDLIIWAGSNKSEFTDLVDMRELKKIIAEIRIGKSGYAYIMDMEGTLVVHPTLEGRNIADMRDASGRHFVKEILSRKNGLITYDWKNPGDAIARPKLLAYRHVPEMNWIVAAGGGFEEMDAQLALLRNIIIATLIVAFLACLVFVSLMLSRFLSPLKVLGEASDRVSEGDLGVVLDHDSKDELGEIAHHFNRIVGNFGDIIKKISGAVDQVTASIQELTVSAREVSTTATQQAASVKEIVSTMEDSDQLARKVETRIDEVAVTAAGTRGMVEEGVSIVSANTEKMDQILSSNADTIRGIRDVGEQIEGIREVIAIINGIADQTKIIAFNAELEAAAAGEQGRNFQIVAGEVRRLADNTFASTEEVKAKIEDIQAASEALVSVSENGTTRIREGNALTMKLREIFGRIRNSAEVSATSSEQIALLIKQQVAAFEQILIALRQISTGIDEFSQSARSTTGAGESLKAACGELEAIVGRYGSRDGTRI